MLAPLSQLVAGFTLLTVVGIAFGGTFLLRIAIGKEPANALQKQFFRAGHAHAGVLVILGLVATVLLDAGAVAAPWRYAYIPILAGAILVPAGFFGAVIGKDPQRPNGLVALIWAGAAVLAVGLVGAGVALLTAGISAL
jgi:hypothetical protein